MQDLLPFLNNSIPKQDTPHRNYRDELVSLFTEGINKERLGTKYKPITKMEVAIRLNRNAFLAGKDNDGEVAYLLKQCQQEGTYKKLFWLTKP